MTELICGLSSRKTTALGKKKQWLLEISASFNIMSFSFRGIHITRDIRKKKISASITVHEKQANENVHVCIPEAYRRGRDYLPEQITNLICESPMVAVSSHFPSDSCHIYKFFVSSFYARSSASHAQSIPTFIFQYLLTPVAQRITGVAETTFLRTSRI